jgi:Domain of unknown function (DUF5668)
MNSRGAMFAQAARGPVLLIVLGTLFALQQGGVLPFSRSWPLLIIAIGVMKLIERMLSGPVPYAPPGGGPAAGYPAQGYTPPPGYRPAAQHYPSASQPYPQAGNQPPEGQPR